MLVGKYDVWGAIMAKKSPITIEKNPDYGTYEVYCEDHGEFNGGYETLKEAREAKANPGAWCFGHNKPEGNQNLGGQFNG